VETPAGLQTGVSPDFELSSSRRPDFAAENRVVEELLPQRFAVLPRLVLLPMFRNGWRKGEGDDTDAAPPGPGPVD
jgi:hypothetical protein